MTISVKLVGDRRYHVLATPPHVNPTWSSEGLVTADVAIAELLARGAHQTDIGDAFYAANCNWLGDDA